MPTDVHRSEWARLVDAGVQALPPHLRQVARVQYIDQRLDRTAMARHQSARGLTKHAWYTMLGELRWFIAGWIEAFRSGWIECRAKKDSRSRRARTGRNR